MRPTPRLTVVPDGATRPGPRRSRPDPTGLRIAIGFGGVAAASALATAFLAPLDAPAAPAGPPTTVLAADTVLVQHVTRYVQLLPGQTAPPNANVAAAAPAPTPRVVVITTRQSGVRP